MPSLASILTYFPYQPSAVGYLSEGCRTSGAALPSTLSMAAPTVVLYLRDELFARPQPLLVPLAAHSTAMLKIPLASERSAETWEAHVADLGAHHWHSMGMASDRGRGLVAGSHAACPDARWVCERFPALRALFDRRRPLARTAYAAMAKEDEAVQTCPTATSEAPRHQRLQPSAHPHQACEPAIARYDPLALRRHLLRDAWYLCAPSGRLRTVGGVRAAVLLLCSLSEESAEAVRPTLLHPLRAPRDAIVAPFAPAASWPVALLDLVPPQR